MPEQYIPFQEPTQNAPYMFDDDHIPTNPENPCDLSGVHVKVTERAKRYQNSVNIYISSDFCPPL